MPAPVPSDRSPGNGALRLLKIGLDAVLAVVASPRCVVCGDLLPQPANGPICDGCWSAVRPFAPPLCPVCGDPVLARPDDLEADRQQPLRTPCGHCRQHPPAIAMAGAIGAYEDALRSAIHALKYGRHRSIAVGLGRLMVIHGRAVLEGTDAVVPVPLHWRRRWRRGFNQAGLLASGLHIAVWPALRRVRATPSQVALPAPERRRNVRGAFEVARRWPWQRPWNVRLKGTIVLLVDDVMTTGATLEACARVLFAAGVREVRVLTAARVPGSRSS